LLPSEYFKRQGAVTFQSDPVGMSNIRFTGTDCLMWGSDYPHPEGTFPDSHRYLEAQMADIPDEVVRAVVWDNASRLYSVTGPATNAT
jgi:predicted TIM-barrel fold metal-dependent hydrolase